MKLTKAIDTQAERRIKYLSKKYLGLPEIIQRFAEPHILINGFYTCTINKKKVLVTR